MMSFLNKVFWMVCVLAFVFLWVGDKEAHAQVLLTIEQSRSNYVLYEPLFLSVIITNQSSDTIVLEDSENQGWLSFIIYRDNGTTVRPDRELHFQKPLTLESGQSKKVKVNITPLYLFRKTGTFKVRAVVDLSGTQYLSGYMDFYIFNGHTIFSQKKPMEDSQRTYSLIRFSPLTNHTLLYLRVENVEENLVYSNFSLGEIVAFSAPNVVFDEEDNIHILHVIGKGIFRYTRASMDGKIESQVSYEKNRKSVPSLVKTQGGAVFIRGGRKKSEKGRERLSEAQNAYQKEKKTPSKLALKRERLSDSQGQAFGVDKRLSPSLEKKRKSARKKKRKEVLIP